MSVSNSINFGFSNITDLSSYGILDIRFSCPKHGETRVHKGNIAETLSFYKEELEFQRAQKKEVLEELLKLEEELQRIVELLAFPSTTVISVNTSQLELHRQGLQAKKPKLLEESAGMDADIKLLEQCIEGLEKRQKEFNAQQLEIGAFGETLRAYNLK